MQPFAGGDEGLVEVGEAGGPSFHCLQVQGVAALQVLVGDTAEPIGAAGSTQGVRTSREDQGTDRQETRETLTSPLAPLAQMVPG